MMDVTERLKAVLNHKKMKIPRFGLAVGQGKQTFYDINSGKIKSISTEVANKIVKAFPEFNFIWLTTGEGEMLNTAAKAQSFTDFLNDYEAPENIDNTHLAADIIARKKGGKGKNEHEGRIVGEDELVPVKTYIIPIKGFAGLRKHFFADDYISQRFEETVTYVPKSERVPKLLKIQADGNSMPPLISPGDYCNCEPIIDLTEDYKFRAEKIYCFFHHSRGILFKRAQNISFGQIELSSDNPDKVEYPNETFEIGEFKRILVVRTIEKQV